MLNYNPNTGSLEILIGATQYPFYNGWGSLDDLSVGLLSFDDLDAVADSQGPYVMGLKISLDGGAGNVRVAEGGVCRETEPRPEDQTTSRCLQSYETAAKVLIVENVEGIVLLDTLGPIKLSHFVDIKGSADGTSTVPIHFGLDLWLDRRLFFVTLQQLAFFLFALAIFRTQC